MKIYLEVETSSSTLIKEYKVGWIPVLFYYLGFTSCTVEQPLQSMELQEKEYDKKDIGKLSREIPKKKGAYQLWT